MTTVFVMGIIPDVQSLGETLNWVFLALFPNHCMARSFMAIYINYLFAYSCVSKYDYRVTCLTRQNPCCKNYGRSSVPNWSDYMVVCIYFFLYVYAGEQAKHTETRFSALNSIVMVLMAHNPFIFADRYLDNRYLNAQTHLHRHTHTHRHRHRHTHTHARTHARTQRTHDCSNTHTHTHMERVNRIARRCQISKMI